MRKYYGTELVGKLSELFGPSGCEGNVAEFIISQIDDCCDAYCTDRAGNVIAKICGGGLYYNADEPRRVMICAHMDEVGVMVSDFTEEGYVKFAPIGSVDPRVLCGRGMILGDENKKIDGIVASKAIHLQSAEERKHATPVSKMNIDIGAENEAEARAVLDIGDVGVFRSEFATFGKDGKYMKGKALEGRLPCAAMIEIMRELKEKRSELACDLYFAFTCCEEIWFSATKVAAQSIRPHVAVVLDSVEAADAGAGEPACSVKLGEGVAISFADTGAIYDRQLTELAIGEAERGHVKYQIKRTATGKTGAVNIQRSCEGVKVVSVAAPVRYMHSASCVCDSEDYVSLKNFVSTLVAANKI
ncbi:MAG: hypothetical protein IJY39_14255 [Clostridia bacterium]|nr:hypothetical protein [Clostridia bacterium]